MSAFFVFYFVIDFVLSDGGYRLIPFTEEPNNFFGRFPILARTLLRICQPLNEEIVLRALLLGFFARYCKNYALLATIAALIFSLLHFILYYCGTLATPLTVSTLLTLFFFALAANALYLTYDHIGFGLVIHVAWNWWRFSGFIVDDEIMLNEAQSFNALEGSMPVLAFVTILCSICVAALIRYDFKKARRSNLETAFRVNEYERSST